MAGGASKVIGVTYKLDISSTQIKGVIHEWAEEDSIEKLIAMIDSTNKLQIEKMVKTYHSKEQGKRAWRRCRAILL